MRQLLKNAPADRSWRRRGYLVLCRAHPDRLQQVYGSSSACTGMAQSTSSRAEMGRAQQASDCGGGAGASRVDGRTGGGWAELMARVVGLQEEGIFRTIVGYL